ncbi:outer membrane protein assembly factor BamB family protein [Sphaerisporangium corydalis]|uniref:PQQ-binding-like beta-propeller repeat protein n=1 Tax=Sphaerisporangium corydalis TaxID=1441875 RepID=A0ABV9EEF1_9ACTN|nr:PQQ-binding-like beta-propeller repeat protein [Sphaerisporangium corydalis]
MRPKQIDHGRLLRRLTLPAIAMSAVLITGHYAVGVPTRAAADVTTYSASKIPSTWTQPNGDKAATRRVSGPINSRSVFKLGVAWTVPIKAPASPDRWPGTYATTPVVVDGIVYTQDLDANVYAIELKTGNVLWTKMYDMSSTGPNGVAYAGGKVFGATTTHAFALDAATGQEVWSKELVLNEFEGIDMAPAVHNGTVYFSTVPGNNAHFLAASGRGVLWALDTDTGRTKWKFDTVPVDLWGNPEMNAGGGLWYPPSFDDKGNLYFTVANPLPFLGTKELPWGSSRPGPNLYTNSLVKLNAKTGKLIWYNQVLPHDVNDWDLMLPPLLTTVHGRPVALSSGKMGIVYMFDQATGKLLWKTPVGLHNGHDDDNLFALRGEFDKLPSLPVTVYPGVLGGVMGPLAVDDTTVYAAVNNFPVTWNTQEPPPDFPAVTTGTGQMFALDLATGRVKWVRDFDHTPYGASTVVNDLVFTTTFDGTIHALSTRTGETVWQDTLPAASNSPVAVQGKYVLAGGGWPMEDGQKAEIIAYRLGADGPAR